MTAITTNGAAVASTQVYSTPPVNIDAACMLVAWSRRSTEKNPVPASERYRGIVVERAALTIAPDACSSKFQRMLQACIHDSADKMFTAWVRDNMSALQYDGAPLTVDNVLAHWAEQKQRETIDAAGVLAWLKASKTFAALPTDRNREAWTAKLPKIAAPSYAGSFTTDEATKMIARIQEEDADSPVGLFILQRLHNVAQRADQSDAL